MDSLTQIVLGGAVGEAVLGRKVGNKAVIWGAIAGTIPDLDVLFRSTHDYVDALELHRGFSHSFTFSILFAPILGWIIWRIHKRTEATLMDWVKLAFFGLITHPILDNFTTWGTEFFWPFSDYRIAWKTIFVIDPLYTVPFLICLVWLMFKKRESKGRRRLNRIGFTVSTFYLLLSVALHFSARSSFKTQLAAQSLPYDRIMVRPTPLNIVLWGVTAETENGYYLGYHSVLDDEKYQIPFAFIEHHKDRLAPYAEHEELQRLLDLTTGFYTVDLADDGFIVNDLRFGEKSVDETTEQRSFVFRYHIKVKDDGSLEIDEYPREMSGLSDAFGEILDRMGGRDATPQ